MRKVCSRRAFIKSSIASLSVLSLGAYGIELVQNKKPNVLFLFIDDLNDWVGCMGGHPDVKTPNLDKLAREGMIFMNANCAAPLCAPSRTALLSGMAPYKTGIYKNRNRLTESSVLDDKVLLPKCFMDNGYFVTGSGKIFHEADHDVKCWNQYWPAIDQPNADTYEPPHEDMPLHGMPVPENTWGNDWGAIPVENRQTGDWKTSGWVAERLCSNSLTEPFFMAWGCKKPHVPLYAPQKYFDMYPIDKISMPKILDNDLDDVPEAAKKIGSYSWPWKIHESIKKYGKARSFVQAYLACISFVDDCIGRVLKDLENSQYKDNTIIILVSDHGIHKGEKENWSKYTLWEEAARVPMIIKGPDIKVGSVCFEPVNLIDVYPTLVDMCDLKHLGVLDGQSMEELIDAPGKDFARVSITTYGPNLNSIRSRDWRYIRYADGSEELYNHTKDPYEWHNLASDSQYETIKKKLSEHIPLSQISPAKRKK
ncbi:MAG: sulfatase [Sedimentisphaeraceae bacterium JB056]